MNTSCATDFAGCPCGQLGIGENMITAKSDPVFGGVYKLAAVKRMTAAIPPR